MGSNYKLRVGLAGVGLNTYWEQFPGLRERLEGYQAVIGRKLAGEGRDIVNFGLIDTPQASLGAGHRSRKEDIDLLLVYVSTYALSATVLPLIRLARVPVILLNLQPEPAIDYAAFHQLPDRTAMTGEWLAYCSACAVPEITNVLRRLDIPFHQVTGLLQDDPVCWSDLEGWLQAAEVAHALAHSRLGLMGHYYSGMLDIATDLAQVSGRFGVHLEMIEVDALSHLREGVTTAALEARLKVFSQFFQFDSDCTAAEKERAARTAVALDELVAGNDLQMMAYYYKGSGNPGNEDTMSSIILGTSMLTAKGVSVAGEYEVKNVLAMQILHLLGAGGSFTEYYAVDFRDDVVLMGHDGPGHAAIAQEKIRVRPLQVYHGKVGRGLSVEMNVQHGPVTLLSVVEDRQHGFQFLIAEGESVPGPTLEIGNTNSRYRFSLGARRFLEQWNAHGPAHHCAIGIGYHAATLTKLSSLLRISSTQIC